MSKAEERALERFPVHEGASKEWIELHLKGFCAEYIEGYHQAEKDLELAWEDIEKITDIWDDLHEDEAVYSKTGYDTPEFYQEILKQFKDYKERKKK